MSFNTINKTTKLHEDILADENPRVVEGKLAKLDKNLIDTFLYAVAIRCQNPNTIDLMVKYGANVNSIYIEGGNTVLMALLVPFYKKKQKYLVKPEIVEALIKHGADVNAKNDDGKRVLDYANGRKEIVDLLVKYGAKQ